MSKFKTPDYIHELIAKAREKNGRHGYSDQVDEALKWLETKHLVRFNASPASLLEEQRYLLRGFRATVMMKGRVSGKVGPILSRNYFFDLLAYLGDSNLKDTVEDLAENAHPDVPTLSWAEMIAFVELFPESISWSKFDNKEKQTLASKYWAQRKNFERPLRKIGFKNWDVSHEEKVEFYKPLTMLWIERTARRFVWRIEGQFSRHYWSLRRMHMRLTGKLP
ncbi:MAG: hypothetical protein EOP04_30435 [Proteobacteria bacterium]|nr:MAG: hypothetical protein EOP04_30435 [Pseudomonadota bacterium]